jgi:hypothetical protein
MSKSLVVKLKPTSNVAISNEKNFSISVSTAYWSSFQLNDLMHQLVVVLASCWNLAQNIGLQTKPTQNATNQLIKVFYETVTVNEGRAWDIRNSMFTARHSGIYVFSVSAYFELSSINNLAANLSKPNSILNTVLLLHIDTINSTLTKKRPVVQVSMARQAVSASRVLNLSKTDTVEVWLHKEYNWLPDVMRTTVSAFYYSPVSNMQVLKLRRFNLIGQIKSE